MREGGNIYFYHNDHLGTPQKMTNISGVTVWSASYDAFGKATVDAGSVVVSNLRFPGQYFDVETGWHYNWHRYYDAGTGRYVSADPIGFRGGINKYIYAKANPLSMFDSDGLKVSCINRVVSVNYGYFFLAGETGYGVLECQEDECPKKKCYRYYFQCLGGSILGGLGGTVGGSVNIEVGKWSGGTVKDITDFSVQVSGSFVPGIGPSGSASLSIDLNNRRVVGKGYSVGMAVGLAGGVSGTGCLTWGLKQIPCKAKLAQEYNER